MARKWVQAAIKRPGALRSKAKQAGAITKSGKIDSKWLNKQAKKGGTTGRQARLAKTMRGFRH